MADDRVFVWGSGGAGQLGLSNTDDYSVPQELLIHTKEIVPETIVTGGCHTAGLSTQGALYLWGDNEKLQLARPRGNLCVLAPEPQLPDASLTNTTTTTTRVRVRVVACGWSHTVAVTTSARYGFLEEEDRGDDPGDQIWTWGANDHHQLARPTTSDTPTHVPQAVPFPALSGRHISGRRVVVSLSCGWKHSLLALNDGSVFSWGSGRHGELGLGSSALVALTPTQLISFGDRHHHHDRIGKVYCGWQHSMFHSTSSGFVYSCGNNRHGQLGVPRASEPSRSTPAQVFLQPTEANPRDPLRASQIDVGWHFTLCVSTENTLYSWGKGAHGQLCHGTSENVALPTRVAFDHRVHQIACGSEHLMVTTQSGDLYTSGWGEHGNLGHGDTENKSQLTKVQFFRDQSLHVFSIAAGGAVSIARTRPL